MAYSPADSVPRLVSIEPRNAMRGIRVSPIIQAMILLMIVANLGRIPVLSAEDRETPLLVNDLFVACVVAVGVVVSLRTRSLRLDSVALLALAFAAVGGGSAILAVPRFGLGGFELLVSLAYLARWLLYFAIYVVVVNAIRIDDVGPVWNAAENMLLVFAAFGIIQAAFLPRFAQLVYPTSRPYYDWDIQGNRLVSTILEPNIAGAMLLIAFLVCLARLATGAPVARWKLLLFFTALVLTLSRSSALGLIAGGLTILVARGLSKRMLRLVAGIAVLLGLVLPMLLTFAAQYNKLGVDASAMDRLVSWARAIRVLIDHPIIGIGFNTFGYVLERYYGVERVGTASYSSDGGFLFIAVLTGVVGLAMYVSMMAIVLRRCRSIWRRAEVAPEQRGFAIGVAASLVAVCVHSMFVNSLLTVFVMELLWLQWGLVFVLAHSLRK